MNDESKLEQQLDEGLEESFPASDPFAVDAPQKPLMNAVMIHEFGGLETLTLEQMQRPSPQAGQVLVRVKAAGVGTWDAWVRAGMSACLNHCP